MVKLGLLALAAVLAPVFAAEPSSPRYDLQVRVLEGSKVLGTPHLVAKSGETATMAADDGHGHGWEVVLTAAPDAAAGKVSVNLRAARWEEAAGERTQRMITTRVLIAEGKATAVEVPAGKGAPAVRVEFSVRSV